MVAQLTSETSTLSYIVFNKYQHERTRTKDDSLPESRDLSFVRARCKQLTRNQLVLEPRQSSRAPSGEVWPSRKLNMRLVYQRKSKISFYMFTKGKCFFIWSPYWTNLFLCCSCLNSVKLKYFFVLIVVNVLSRDWGYTRCLTRICKSTCKGVNVGESG